MAWATVEATIGGNTVQVQTDAQGIWNFVGATGPLDVTFRYLGGAPPGEGSTTIVHHEDLNPPDTSYVLVFPPSLAENLLGSALIAAFVVLVRVLREPAAAGPAG
jgi:hypothetical protein